MNKKLANIIRGELIGLKVEVVAALNNANLGIKGVVRDETKHTITIDDKMIMKKNVTLQIGEIKVDGKLLESRPAERIKVKI